MPRRMPKPPNHGFDPASFTYGAELELGDIDRALPLPEGCKYDLRDYTMVNSNGIAVDPKAELYGFGGEVNTRPTTTIDEQCQVFCDVFEAFPKVDVNYRGNLHIHIGVPGLLENLPALKRLQSYASRHLKEVLNLVEPIPHPRVEGGYDTPEELAGALRRYRRRRVSHHTILPYGRVAAQNAARTLEEFFEAEVPRTKAEGRPMWHAQPRAAVNIRQLKETGTIEFRHFPMTGNVNEFLTAVKWCRDFMDAALNTDESAVELFHRKFAERAFPRFERYCHWQEERYRRTVLDGSLPREVVKANIAAILEEDNAHATPTPRRRSVLR